MGLLGGVVHGCVVQGSKWLDGSGSMAVFVHLGCRPGSCLDEGDVTGTVWWSKKGTSPVVRMI